MSTPLTPVINSAKATIAAGDDVAAFWSALESVVSIPEQKTLDDIASLTVRRNQNNSLSLAMQFKP